MKFDDDAGRELGLPDNIEVEAEKTRSACARHGARVGIDEGREHATVEPHAEMR